MLTELYRKPGSLELPMLVAKTQLIFDGRMLLLLYKRCKPFRAQKGKLVSENVAATVAIYTHVEHIPTIR